MKRFLAGAWKRLRGLPLALVAPILLLLAALAVFLCDLLCWLRSQTKLPSDTAPDARAALEGLIPDDVQSGRQQRRI